MNRIPLILAVAGLLAAQTGLSAPGTGEKLSISITNRFGDVFTNPTVVQVYADGLLLEHRAGQMKVKFAELPPAVRTKYQLLAAAVAKKEAAQATNPVVALLPGQMAASQPKVSAQPIQLPENPPVEKTIEVPGQGWKIVVLDPGLAETVNQSSGDEFTYRANTTDGFYLGIMVMNPAQPGTADEDVFRYYWPQMNGIQAIDKSSVRAERAPKFIKVSYKAQGVPNVNYYFAYRGKWIDVHIAKTSYTDADAKLLDDFEAHLAYY